MRHHAMNSVLIEHDGRHHRGDQHNRQCDPLQVRLPLGGAGHKMLAVGTEAGPRGDFPLAEVATFHHLPARERLSAETNPETTGSSMPSTDPIADLAALIEAAPGPSPYLDARLRTWAGLPAVAMPTDGLDTADAFCQAVAPGTTWALSGTTGHHTASITTLGDRLCTVLFSGRGCRPGLALLAAFVRARGP